MDHVVVGCSLVKAGLFETDVSQALETCWIRDVSSGSLRSSGCRRDENASQTVGWMGKETCKRGASWSSSDNEKRCFDDLEVAVAICCC